MNEPTFDVSDFAPDILNVALTMSLEWGGNFSKPINQRMQALYPALTDEAASNLNSWCIEVRHYAFDLAEKDYPIGTPRGDSTGTSEREISDA